MNDLVLVCNESFARLIDRVPQPLQSFSHLVLQIRVDERSGEDIGRTSQFNSPRGLDTTFEDEWTKLQKENKVHMTLACKVDRMILDSGTSTQRWLSGDGDFHSSKPKSDSFKTEATGALGHLGIG